MYQSLEEIRLNLLPTAKLLGYTDVKVGMDVNQYGFTYWATAFGPHRYTTLANIIDHRTPQSMLDASMDVLLAELGQVATF